MLPPAGCWKRRPGRLRVPWRQSSRSAPTSISRCTTPRAWSRLSWGSVSRRRSSAFGLSRSPAIACSRMSPKTSSPTGSGSDDRGTVTLRAASEIWWERFCYAQSGRSRGGADMTREADVVRSLVEMADTLVDDYDVVDLLTGLASRCVTLLGASAAGVMLASPAGSLGLVASSSEAMRLLELFELQAQEGPCVDAFRSGETTGHETLITGSSPWP